MGFIGIDRQMIVKAKIWILLYKNFVVSHSALIEDKYEFKLRVLIYCGFTVYLMLFPENPSSL